MMITNIDDYFSKGCGRCERFATPECSTRPWIRGLTTLREICIETGLREIAKWGQPCYMHGARNVAIIGAFRKDYRLSFFDAALLKDPSGVLEKPGPNAQHPDMIRFTSNEQVTTMRPILIAYLSEAIGYAAAGMRPPKENRPLDVPGELSEALDADPELAVAFKALTPGRQKSYAIAIGSAKKAETRISRIAIFRNKIIEGKGATER